MKELTPAKMLEAIDRALAEAARLAALRQEQLATQKREPALAEDPEKFDPSQR